MEIKSNRASVSIYFSTEPHGPQLERRSIPSGMYDNPDLSNTTLWFVEWVSIPERRSHGWIFIRRLHQTLLYSMYVSDCTESLCYPYPSQSTQHNYDSKFIFRNKSYSSSENTLTGRNMSRHNGVYMSLVMHERSRFSLLDGQHCSTFWDFATKKPWNAKCSRYRKRLDHRWQAFTWCIDTSTDWRNSQHGGWRCLLLNATR